MEIALLIVILFVVLFILAEATFLAVRGVASQSRGVLRQGGGRAILVDTSVLIDGRILDIAGCGFIPGRLVVPRSVLGELQLLADGADHEKRARARNGLEVVTKLQNTPGISVEIYGDDSEAREGVDNRLLALALKLSYELCTVDYNLQKVAQAEGITILSINELSQKLRSLYLPGERIELTLKQKGQEKGQAIGYAADGTMVVVDGADKLIDQSAQVEIIRSLQTNSGKMLFAKLPAGQGQGRGSANANGGRQRGARQATQAKPQAQASADPAPATPQVFHSESLAKPQRSSRGSRGGRGRGRQGPKSAEDDLLNLVNGQ